MEASAVDNAIVERANELYWSSDRSVNQIADELDLSKGALYAMVEPEPAGVGCPMCGSEVGYANRTTKDRGQLECPTCEWDGSRDEAVAVVDEPAVEEPASGRVPQAREDDGDEGSVADGYDPPPVVTPPEGRLRAIAGGALLGAAVGLALVIWARRR